ncbi:MAG: ribose-5-phosphate isomerase RpiA [Anaerolineales bacterium]|nr:MAG: ribose-5-phosphate isomerase RpiA [Anaerolineales bacterium]
MSADQYKQAAAQAAVAFVESGMVVGLGHGSTVQYALEALAARLQAGELTGIIGIPCSKHTQNEATRLGIPLGDINQHAHIDLTLDGADEVDPQLNLIKGGGGALLREKIVAQASQREVIMVDEGKLSDALGTRFDLPVEVLPFAWQHALAFITGLGGEPRVREQAGMPVLSDQGNYLLDCAFGPIAEPQTLARQLESRAGIVEHGLFLGLATDVFVAGPAGVRHLTRG